MLKKNNWVKPFTYALIVFAAPLLAYYLIYVQAREEALLDRTYSHLTNITTRTEARFNSIFEVISNACKQSQNFAAVLEKNDLGLTAEDFDQETKDNCPSLRNQERTQTRSILITGRDALRITYGNILVDADTKELVGDIDLSDRFHDIFIFDDDGNVIYQKYPENGRIDNLVELEPDSDANGEEKILISDPLKSMRVNFRGRWYLMPSQPLQIDLNQTEQESWRMVGLIEESQFNTEKLQFQPDTVAWVVLLIAVIILIGPFLKVWYLGRFESFKKIDVVLLIASGFTLCSLLTVVVIQLSWRDGLNDFIGDRLRAISTQMAADINTELEMSIDELTRAETAMRTAFDRIGNIDDSVFKPYADCPFLARSDENNSAIDNSWKGNLLQRPVAGYTPSNYPFFNMVYLMDQSGCQIMKWSTREQPTNALQLEDRVYYQRPKPNAQVPSDLFTLNGKEFFIEFITSRTTGEKSVALSMPISDERSNGDSPREICLTTAPTMPAPCVAVMTTPSFRVFQSVLPHGFGFAMVNQAGNILAHHEGTANTELNLIEELRDGRLLQRALFSRSEDQFSTDYHGDHHEFLVKPLDIQGIDLYLVSFYSTNTALMPLLEAAGTTLMAWLIWFALLFCLALTLWQWDKFLEGQLFARISAAVQKFEVVLLFGTAVAILLALRWPIVSLIAPIYIVSVLMSWLFKVSNNFRSRPFTVVAISWVLMLSATSLPVLGLFRLIQAEAFSSFLQLQLLEQEKALAAQQHTMHDWLAKVRLPTEEAQTDGYAKFRGNEAAPSDRFPQVWKHYPLIDAATAMEALELESTNRNEQLTLVRVENPDSKVDTDAETINPWQYLLGKLPDYSDESTRLHAMYRNPKAVAFAGETRSTKELAQAIYQARISGQSNGLAELLGLVLLIILGVALWFVLVRTLGLRTENYLRLFNYTIPTINRGSRDLIYGMGEFTKREYFTQVEPQRITWVDLRIDAAEEVEDKLAAVYALEAEQEPAQSDIVILDHFDDGLIDAQVVLSRIALLEKLVRKEKVSIIVLLAVDPLSFVTATYDADQQASMIARLASVLTQFDACFYQESPPAVFGESKVERTLREECYHPNLRAIYHSIYQQSSEKLVDSNEVIQLVKSRANAIYQHMWNLCSHAEKIMLVELAHENLVNPNNWDLARRLKQRGYLRRDPFHRIFNESFKQFILRMERVDNIESWRKESASTWHNIRAPLFVLVIGAIVFLAFTQPSFFNSVFAFAAAGTASLPFLVNLIMARLKSSGGN